MEKRFEVEGLAYVVDFHFNEFRLYVDTLASKNKLLYDKDSLDFKFGDVPPDNIYHQIDSPSAFRVTSNVMKFVHNVIKGEKPYFFYYIANEEHKIRSYRKIAARIGIKYGYDIFEENGNKFSFFKKY